VTGERGVLAVPERGARRCASHVAGAGAHPRWRTEPRVRATTGSCRRSPRRLRSRRFAAAARRCACAARRPTALQVQSTDVAHQIILDGRFGVVVGILAYYARDTTKPNPRRVRFPHSTNIFVHEHVYLYWIWVFLCIICMCLQKKCI
jgi:hypothetical protein